MNITTLFEKHNLKIESVEIKDFGTIIRANGLNILDSIRLEMFENGHKTPISCHREEGSTESFMIVWNK